MKDGREPLRSKILVPGVGSAHPGPRNVVTAHYTAWAADGTTIDDSRSRGTPAAWIPEQLMEGLKLGLQLMVAGETRRFWIPAGLCHEWAKDMLVYDIEVLSVAPPPQWPTRDEIATAPADATRTPSGVWMKQLRPGTGANHPRPTSTVTIHYTEWTASGGSIYDDTVARDAPLTVDVDLVMPGLSDALQHMVVGEKTRVWIPAELTYVPPIPRAALLFDVELLAIQQAVAGLAGTVRVQSNSPDGAYDVIMPDGTARRAKGPQTFTGVAAGRYRIKPTTLRSYAVGIVASPVDMTLAPGGTLDVTITYAPIVR